MPKNFAFRTNIKNEVTSSMCKNPKEFTTKLVLNSISIKHNADYCK